MKKKFVELKFFQNTRVFQGIFPGYVTDIVCNCDLQIASKEVFRPKKLNFMHGFKSSILPELKNCQNGTFEPVHGVQKKIGPKTLNRYEDDIYKRYP